MLAVPFNFIEERNLCMKTSTRNCCCFIVASILIAIGVVLMAFFGLLPCLLTATEMVIHLIVCILLLLFILTSLTGCHCLRKLAWVLCQYGTCLIVALIIALLTGVMIVMIPYICGVMFMIFLFIHVASFLYALMLLAAMLITMAKLGCPRCKTVVKRTCENGDFAEFEDMQ